MDASAIVGSVAAGTSILSTAYLIGKAMDRRAPVNGILTNGAYKTFTTATQAALSERMAKVETELGGLRREMKIEFRTVFRLLGKHDDPGSDDAP